MVADGSIPLPGSAFRILIEWLKEQPMIKTD
jgi:hypothetical protein